MSSNAVTSSQQASSPTLSHTGFPTFAAVTTAAQSFFSAPASQSSATPLANRITPLNLINSLLKQADENYKKGNLEEANPLYQAALANFEHFKIQPDATFYDPSNIPAGCYIGIAKTCDASEKETNVQLAEQALKYVNQNKAKWNALNPEEKSTAYLLFRRNLERFKPLIPQSKHAEIDPLIEECKTHILSIDAAYYELGNGQELYKQNDITGAKAAYEKALDHAHNVPAQNRFTAEFRILTALIHIHYANTYEEEDNERITHCENAYEQIIRLQKYESADVYQTLLSLCNRLIKLVPKTQQGLLQSIQSIVKDCQSKLAALKKSATGNQGPSRSGKGSRRQRNYLGLLVALAFASLVVYVGVALYRRLITKIE